MPRPKKKRTIALELKCNEFVPVVPVCLDTNIMSVEELEALRLKDCLTLDQRKCAARMRISQPTFHRLLLQARKKSSDAIVNAKELKIRA